MKQTLKKYHILQNIEHDCFCFAVIFDDLMNFKMYFFKNTCYHSYKFCLNHLFIFGEFSFSLVQWLKYSRKEYCELCKHRFAFTPSKYTFSA